MIHLHIFYMMYYKNDPACIQTSKSLEKNHTQKDVTEKI